MSQQGEIVIILGMFTVLETLPLVVGKLSQGSLVMYFHPRNGDHTINGYHHKGW